MVVDNHIDVVCNRSLNHSIHHLLIAILLVSCKVVSAAPLFIDPHRGANQLNPLFFDKTRYIISGPKRSAHITCNAPEKAHALHDYFGTISNTLTGTVNLPLAVRILASLQLTILAYRTDPVCRESRRKQPQGKYRKSKPFSAEFEFHTSSSNSNVQDQI